MKIRFFATVLLIVLLASVLSGCFFLGVSDPEFLYDGPYPMLHEALRRSVLGMPNHASNYIAVLEQDAAGRTLYLFLGSSGVTSYLFYKDDSSARYTLAVLAVAQSYDESTVSYYEDKSFIVDYIRDDKLPTGTSQPGGAQASANKLFGAEKILELKEANDWGKPLGQQPALTQTGPVESPFSDEELEAILTPYAKHYYRWFLNTDSQGNSIYFLINKDTMKFYLAFVRADGTVPETGFRLLWNMWDYTEDLRQFKADNGWAPTLSGSYENGIPYTEATGGGDYFASWEFTLDEPCIPDKETAVAVTSAMVEAFQKSGYFPGYGPQEVTYLTDLQIWVVEFWDSQLAYPSSTLSIAIQKDTGQVVKMQVNE